MTAMAHLTLLLVLLWVDSTVSSVEDLQKRIIGGKECTRDYHVILRGDNVSDSFFCGGSLISNQWILTAAHCWEPGWTFHAYRVNPNGKTEEMKIEQNPVIYTDANKQPHDLMLVKLSKPSGIRPVPLPRCDQSHYPPEEVQVAGYGATSGHRDGTRKPGESATLHCADIDVVDCEDFKEVLQKVAPVFYNGKEYQHWLCGQTSGKDICEGDSGGGAVHGGKIYGVISFSGNSNRVCKAPFAFMDLCNKEYLDWIIKTIKG